MTLRPNVMLIVLDTARADAFEPYGAPSGASPALAQLAGAGTAVERAYAPSSWTVPSHAGLLTGELPRSLGLCQAPDGKVTGTRPTLRALDDLLVPAVLKRNGYVTAGASCNTWISPAGGWDTGFDTFDHVPSARRGPGRSLRGTARWLWHSVAADIDDGARAVEDRVRDWFSSWDAQQPFFWFVNLVECHSPYLPPRPYNDFPPHRRLASAVDARRYQTLEGAWGNTLGQFDVPPAALRRMRHLYARSIRALDDWVARVLDLLAGHGVLDDTIVIVTSDHGENFGEGGNLGHAFSLDDRLIRVPFIVDGPVEVPPDALWSLLDVPALLADTLGLDHDPWTRRSPDEPIVAQFDPLAERGDPRVAELVDEWDLDERGIRLITEPLTCVTDGRRKVLRHGDEDVIFDLLHDPLEVDPRRDVSAAELQALLDHPRVWSRAGDPPPADEEEPSPEEVDEIEEQMRLLGYL